ncbi:MAG: HAMP domain-containing protein, partial [candidate division Zixibacteria bacterium]|nr:HAMP domain-containing protein [candidate division Zixibacteria bacterium]
MKIPGRNIRFNVRTKITLTVSVLLIASVVAVSTYLIHSQTTSYLREVETNGETMIRIFAVQAETGVLLESRYELDELLNQLLVFGNVEYADIENAEGTVLSRLGEWDDTRIVRREATHLTLKDHGCETNARITDRDGRQFIDLQYPVFSRIETVDRENLGITTNLDDRLLKDVATEKIGSMRLILSLDEVEKAASEAKITAIVVTAIVLALTILVLTVLARAMTKPLKILVEITDKVSRGDLNQKVEIDQNDEIGHLANTFSNMIESLKASRDEIEEYNRNLEQKIIERTLALEDAQSQLVQSEKMSAIGQLAAGVAHELNNPLGGILGYAQFALEKMKRQLAETPDDKEMQGYVRYLGDIESQSRRCKNIVQNLLRFSRSTRTSEFDDVEINQVIEETRIFVGHQLHMKQINLVVELNENLPEVPGNAGQLQQVFTNMIINA